MASPFHESPQYPGSVFDPKVLDKVEQQPTDTTLDDLPTLEELQVAVRRMGNGKAAGQSGILPEMLKCGGTPYMSALLDLIKSIWEAERVPQDWVDCNLVPIPKKGDLRSCDNWHGIALLDVVGKVLARIIQCRLQSLADIILLDTQCDFRSGSSCTDMVVYSVRQMVEKFYEHRCKGFLVFVDLRKAYDSVNWECL